MKTYSFAAIIAMATSFAVQSSQKKNKPWKWVSSTDRVISNSGNLEQYANEGVEVEASSQIVQATRVACWRFSILNERASHSTQVPLVPRNTCETCTNDEEVLFSLDESSKVAITRIKILEQHLKGYNAHNLDVEQYIRTTVELLNFKKQFQSPFSAAQYGDEFFAALRDAIFEYYRLNKDINYVCDKYYDPYDYCINFSATSVSEEAQSLKKIFHDLLNFSTSKLDLMNPRYGRLYVDSISSLLKSSRAQLERLNKVDPAFWLKGNKDKAKAALAEANDLSKKVVDSFISRNIDI